jgi:hypothetical protein
MILCEHGRDALTDSCPECVSTGRADARGRVTTYADASALAPSELARMLAASDPYPHPVTDGAALENVAVMAALRDALTRLLPLGMHLAVLDGADRATVATAAGMTDADARTVYATWAHRVRLDALTRPGPGSVPADELETVTAVMSARPRASVI